MTSVGKLTPREALALAIQMEEHTEKRLRPLVDLFTDYAPEVYRTFSRLLDEEIAHREKILGVWKDRFGDEIIPAASEETIHELARSQPSQPLNPEAEPSLENALEMVKDAERDATLFYENAAEVISDPEIKSLFLQMAQMEAGHAEAMSRVLLRGMDQDAETSN